MTELARALEIVERLRDLADSFAFGEIVGDQIAQAADRLESLYAPDPTQWSDSQGAESHLIELADSFPPEIEDLMGEAVRLIHKRGMELMLRGVNLP